jgi:YVTN family beta-propeller protein
MPAPSSALVPALVSIAILVGACSSSAPNGSAAAQTTEPGPTLGAVAATTIAVEQPIDMVVSGGDIWMISGSQVARLDPTTKVITPVDVGAAGEELDGLDVTDDAIWVADFDSSDVIRLARTPDAKPTRISVGAAEDVLAVGSTIWVTNHHEGSVSRIDATTGTVLGTVTTGPVGSSGPQQIAANGDSVWVDERNSAEVIHLDAKTGQVVAHIKVPFGPCGGILTTDTAVWATGCHEATRIAHIDPATNQLVGVVPIDGYAQDVVLIDGAVWVAVGGFVGDTLLERIDPATNTVAEKLAVPGMKDVGPSVVASNALWVSDLSSAVYAIPLTSLKR